MSSAEHCGERWHPASDMTERHRHPAPVAMMNSGCTSIGADTTCSQKAAVWTSQFAARGHEDQVSTAVAKTAILQISEQVERDTASGRRSHVA